MSRFVHIKDDSREMYLNTRFITGITSAGDRAVYVEMYDGEKIKLDRSYLPKLMGDNHIVSAVCCDDLYAVYGDHGMVVGERPVLGVAVTASGRTRPLGYDGEFQDDSDEDDDFYYMGMVVKRQ